MSAGPRGVGSTAGAASLDRRKSTSGPLTQSRGSVASVTKLDLMGTTEIGQYLGVSRQRAGQLAATDGFPEAVADLAAGRVWLRSEVETWAKATGRA